MRKISTKKELVSQV